MLGITNLVNQSWIFLGGQQTHYVYLCTNVDSLDEPIIMKTIKQTLWDFIRAPVPTFPSLHSSENEVGNRTKTQALHGKIKKRYSSDNAIARSTCMCIVHMYRILHLFHRSLPPKQLSFKPDGIGSRWPCSGPGTLPTTFAGDKVWWSSRKMKGKYGMGDHRCPNVHSCLSSTKTLTLSLVKLWCGTYVKCQSLVILHPFWSQTPLQLRRNIQSSCRFLPLQKGRGPERNMSEMLWLQIWVQNGQIFY